MELTKMVLSGLIGFLIGAIIIAGLWFEDIHDFKTEAVLYDCGHYDVYGEFDWNLPELEL